MSTNTKNQRTSFHHTSRRSFLGQSSAVVAATTLSGAIARSAHAAGDETIKVALIGCGGRGAGAASQAFKTKGPIKLWAMADVFEDRLESSLAGLTKGQKKDYDREAHAGFSAQVDIPPERRFVGFDAYKKAIDSGVDMVILASPPHFRPVHYEYAVKQGKHVFMEKPVAVDATGIRRLLAANEEAKRKNLKIVVGLQRRHNLRYQETVKRIHDGAIGDIVFMRCYWDTHSICRDHPQPGMAQMQHQMRNWQCFTWLGGDHIVEAHTHSLDVCNWLKGAHPVTAQGQGGRQVHTGPECGNIFDHHFVEFTYEDGTKMFSQCRTISGCWNSVSEHIHGTNGRAEVNRGRIEGAQKWRFRNRIPNPYQVEHNVLFDAVRNNKPHNETEFSAISTMTAIMGRMATYSGKMIRWEDAINSSISLAPERYAWDVEPPVLPDDKGVYPVAIPGVTKVL